MGAVNVRDVVHSVIAEVAPEELPVVRGLAELDDETAVRLLGKKGAQDEPLGFGVDEIIVMVTPVVWLALDAAVQQVVDAAGDGAARGLRAALRKTFRRSGSRPRLIPALTPDQLAEVREQVIGAASERGITDERATTIGDTVVRRLALMTTEQREPELPAPAPTE